MFFEISHLRHLLSEVNLKQFDFSASAILASQVLHSYLYPNLIRKIAIVQQITAKLIAVRTVSPYQYGIYITV